MFSSILPSIFGTRADEEIKDELEAQTAESHTTKTESLLSETPVPEILRDETQKIEKSVLKNPNFVLEGPTISTPELLPPSQYSQKLELAKAASPQANQHPNPPQMLKAPARQERKSSLFPAPNSAQRASSGTSSGLGVPGRSPRKKVGLQPGHSPLDWAALNQKSPKHLLRGVPQSTPPPQFVRISKDELKLHKTQTDCWTSLNGKVFNITPYVNFHPGGVEEIMKCAGKDGTSLFNKYHSWVNADRMLENCIVGVLS